jgi:hypothetical protein
MAADPVIMYAKILAKNIKKPMTSDSRIAKRCSRMSFSVEVKSVPFKPASKSKTLGLPRVHWGVSQESYHTERFAYHADLPLDRTSIFPRSRFSIPSSKSPTTVSESAECPRIG